MKKKKQRNAEKSHQTTEFEIALCQLGLLFLISHYVAGLFWRRLFVSLCDWNSNDCRLVWLFAQKRETQEDILQYH